MDVENAGDASSGVVVLQTIQHVDDRLEDRQCGVEQVQGKSGVGRCKRPDLGHGPPGDRACRQRKRVGARRPPRQRQDQAHLARRHDSQDDLPPVIPGTPGRDVAVEDESEGGLITLPKDRLARLEQTDARSRGEGGSGLGAAVRKRLAKDVGQFGGQG